jgi:hypothetical protein
MYVCMYMLCVYVCVLYMYVCKYVIYLFMYICMCVCMHDIKELQKTAILGTVHVVRKVLMLKSKTFIVENNITSIRYCNHRIASTSYMLET